MPGLEKEMYAIVFGCERFHQFVYGRNVQTDHLPLISICRKPLYAAPARLHRMLLRLQRNPGQNVHGQNATGHNVHGQNATGHIVHGHNATM